MKSEIIHLIKDKKEGLWNNYESFNEIYNEVGAPFPPVQHLTHIKENSGEKIIIYYPETNEILGWIGIIPRSEEGFAELAGIETNINYRKKGIGTKLVSLARDWLRQKNITEFRFQTSPLFTANTLLYMNKFNTKYYWNGTFNIPPDNKVPWPVVDCVMNWTKPETPSDIPFDSEYEKHCLISWNGLKPDIRISEDTFSKHFLTAELPFLSLPVVFGELQKGNFEITEKPHHLFQKLHDNGFGFKSFVRKADRYFYIFSK